MRESLTFQKVLREEREEGRAMGARETLLRLGRKRFGEPDVVILEAIEGIDDPDALEAIADRLLEAENWHELFPRSQDTAP